MFILLCGNCVFFLGNVLKFGGDYIFLNVIEESDEDDGIGKVFKGQDFRKMFFGRIEEEEFGSDMLDDGFMV